MCMNRVMRIISFGDIHMSLHNIERLGPELRASDLVILSGDLTNFGGPDDAGRVLAATRRHASQLLAVAGNLDQPELIAFLEEQGVSLHGAARRIGDLGIFGCGGSNRTPFHTPTELSEEDIGALLERGYAVVADAPQRLMVCHTPPVDTVTDRISSGLHVGSPTVRAFIEAHQPDVCVTGHIHESAGVDRIGRTTVVNAGAFRDGGYIVVTDRPDGLAAELRYL
jgi:Icc-related predicted phosphoesterase